MSTFLADGVARLLMAVAILLAFVILFLFGAVSVAFAQHAVAVTPTGPVPVPDATWAETIDIWIGGAVAMLLTFLGGVGAWLSPHLPGWARMIFDKITTGEAFGWEGLTEKGLKRAFSIAAARAGITPENMTTLEQKDDFVGWAVGALRKYNKEIVSWVDKDGNGVIDFIEDELLQRGADPKLFQAAPDPWADEARAAPQTPQAAMGFMAGAQSGRRAQRSPEAVMASKMVRRPKGTVTQ